MSAGEFYQMFAGLGDGFMKGYEFGNKISDRRRAQEQEATLAQMLAGMTGGASSAQTQASPVQPASQSRLAGGNPAFREAISSIESGGRYGITGPVTKSGDRAYGKYQVMGANIPSWTREALGQEMTPAQFLASPEAQDAVFDHRFGGYVQKYGNPQDAASAWFTGRPLAQGRNSRDILGTSGQGYVDRFTAALARSGGVPAGQAIQQAAPAGEPQQVAQAPQQAMSDAPAMAMQRRPVIDPRLLMGILNNPQAGAGAKAIAQTLLAKQFESKDPMAQMKMALEIQKLQREVQGDGATPLSDQERQQFGIPQGQAAYKTRTGEIKFGPAGTSVNIDQKGETEFAKTAGKAQATRFNEMVEQGQKSQAIAADFQALTDLASKIGTGKQAEVMAAIGPYAQALGVDVKNLGEMEAFNAIVARLAPQMRMPGSGATSDFEMRKFLEALPALGRTPQGNAIITRTFAAVQQRQLRAAEIASKAMAGELKPAEAEKMLRELPDPMALIKKTMPEAMKDKEPPKTGEAQSQEAMPTVSTPAEAMKLPKGTRFRDPQGNIRVVP